MDVLERGFADPVLDAQRVFRAVMDALARPGSIQLLHADLTPPFPLTPELAALALALADQEAPLWLDGPLAASTEVADFLRFHTGAAITPDPVAAAFALVADAARCPPFDRFALGSPEYPDRSTTIVLAVDDLGNDSGFTLRGPGIDGRAKLRAEPLPADMYQRLRDNRALFPLGVDLLFAGPACVAGLPRSSELTGEA